MATLEKALTYVSSHLVESIMFLLGSDSFEVTNS